MSKDADDVVLGAIFRYNWHQLEPFVKSLRATGYRGRVVFLCSQVTPETMHELTTHGVEAITMPFYGRQSLNRYIARTTRRVRVWPAIRLLGQLPYGATLRFMFLRYFSNFATARFVRYREFLSQCTPDSRVLLTDVRDVLFQDDPFRGISPGTEFLHAFTEGRGSCPIVGASVEYGATARWIRDAAGDDMLDRLAGNDILCSGTIMGSCRLLVKYLDILISLMHRARDLGHEGIDQGLHNIAWYTNAFGGMAIIENFAGNVLTAGILPVDEIPIGENGEIVGNDGRAVPVIHQLDRHPPLNAKVTRLLLARESGDIRHPASQSESRS